MPEGRIVLKNLAPWEVCFPRKLSIGDVVIAANGKMSIDKEEVLNQVYADNKLIKGSFDDIGSHATIYIEDDATRLELEFDSEDGNRKQFILDDKAFAKMFEYKTLKTFKEYSQAQDYAATQTSLAKASAPVSAKAVQILAQSVRSTSMNSSISPFLQMGKTSGELEKESSRIRTKTTSTSSSTNATNGIKNGFRTAGEEESSVPTFDTEKTPSPVPTPNPSQAPTPNPNQTPPPEPGPSLDLFGVDVRYISEESRKRLYYICKQLNSDGVVHPEEYRSYYKELDNIRQEEEKGIYFEKIKSGASKEATWGTETIYDQRIYSNVPGTFGPWGSIPENVCGVAAIHNVNQILGSNTRFSCNSSCCNGVGSLEGD